MIDPRFKYVAFAKLSAEDQIAVRGLYPYTPEWLHDSDYTYPVRKDGRIPRVRTTRDLAREVAEKRYVVWLSSQE